MIIPIKDAVEIGSKVIRRAESDAAFRELALKDGTAAVEQTLGSQLPDGLKVQFVESPRGTITIGLPPAGRSDELSDSDLEQVAGGRVGDDVAQGILQEVPGVVASFFRR